MDFKSWLSENETIPCGDCFRFATKLGTSMLADGIIPENDIKIVHGVVRPKWYHKEYEHAWVESRGRVYDWQMKVRGQGSIPIKDFYELYDPDPKRLKTYKPGAAVGMMAKHGHHGPWEI